MLTWYFVLLRHRRIEKQSRQTKILLIVRFHTTCIRKRTLCSLVRSLWDLVRSILQRLHHVRFASRGKLNSLELCQFQILIKCHTILCLIDSFDHALLTSFLSFFLVRLVTSARTLESHFPRISWIDRSVFRTFSRSPMMLHRQRRIVCHVWERGK